MKKFRVYVRYTSLYFLVQVWDTKKALEEYKLLQNMDDHEDCAAYVDSYDIYVVSRKKRGKPQTTRKMPQLGEINFYKGRLGTEVITHETIHAVSTYMRRRCKRFSEMDKENDNYMKFEEEFAYIVGRFNSDLVSKLYKYNLIREE
jgi:hypothetical protein